MKRRVRWLLAPGIVAGSFLAGGVVAEVFAWVMFRLTELPIGAPELEGVRRAVAVWFMFFLGLYGLQRVFTFHPVLNRRYRQWLEVSPWSNRLPLPLGPVMFAWQDVLMIAAITSWASLRWGGDPFLLVASFCITYAIASLAPLGILRRLGEIVVILVLLPLLILFAGNSMAILIIASGMFLVAQFGMFKTLASFPWPRKETKPRADWLGFPYNRLAPCLPGVRLPAGAGLGIALIVGWWVAALTWGGEEIWRAKEQPRTAGMCILFAVLVALVRFVVYSGTFHPPISAWGRIWTGHWIIPRYDYVLLAPPAVFASGAVMPAIAMVVFVPPPLVIAGSVVLMLSLAMELGPTLDHWRLTGAHRVTGLRPPQQRRPGQSAPA